MQRIIKAIEEKMAAQENIIFVRDCEIKNLKKELAERDRIIEEQTHIIEKLEQTQPVFERR